MFWGHINCSDMSCLFLFHLYFLFNFSFTAYIHYYFVLVSGVQHSSHTIVYFTKCPCDICSIQLAAYTVITIRLTIFPVLYFISS